MIPSRRPESEPVPLVWDLISHNFSMEGKLVTTVVIVAIAIVIGPVVGRVWSRRVDDRYHKLYAADHSPSGALGQVGGVELALVTRSPTVAGWAMVAGIMQCAAWV
jgi:hypothetical protein